MIHTWELQSTAFAVNQNDRPVFWLFFILLSLIMLRLPMQKWLKTPCWLLESSTPFFEWLEEVAHYLFELQQRNQAAATVALGVLTILKGRRGGRCY